MSGQGPDFDSLPRWVRQIAEKAGQPGFDRWRQMIAGTGACTSPIRLVGDSTTIDTSTGEVLDTYSTRNEPTEYLLVACGNRRASRCEPCARVYADDTFYLIRSGLAGGRDVPASVATHPMCVRVFATFTAPSFGSVHTRAVDSSGAVKLCHPRRSGPSCMARHLEGDPLLGQALDTEHYDYATAVLRNNRAGELRHMFTVYLRRTLAEVVGVPRSKLSTTLRLEYAKVAEYQARGSCIFTPCSASMVPRGRASIHRSTLTYKHSVKRSPKPRVPSGLPRPQEKGNRSECCAGASSSTSGQSGPLLTGRTRRSLVT